MVFKIFTAKAGHIVFASAELPELLQVEADVEDKPVNITFSGRFPDDIFVVVITYATTEFLVVHFRFVLTSSPQFSNFIRICHFKLPPITSPTDKRLIEAIC